MSGLRNGVWEPQIAVAPPDAFGSVTMQPAGNTLVIGMVGINSVARVARLQLP